jgi:hypothetical protein
MNQQQLRRRLPSSVGENCLRDEDLWKHRTQRTVR